MPNPLPQNFPDPAALFEELGLDLLPEEERDAFLADLGELIFSGAMQRTFASLPDEGKEELGNLLEASAADPESDGRRAALETFIKERVPDFDSFVLAEIEAFVTAYREDGEKSEK